MHEIKGSYNKGHRKESNFEGGKSHLGFKNIKDVRRLDEKKIWLDCFLEEFVVFR